MWTWLLNPKNLLLVALAALLITASGLYLWERGSLNEKETTIAKQAADILARDKNIADLNGQVADYQANIAAARKAQVEMQRIIDEAPTEAEMETTAKLVIGGDDEKKLDNLFMYFNNGGVHVNPNSSAKAGAEVLSKTTTANTGNPVKQRYSFDQIMNNCRTVIIYALEFEKTEACHESGN
jgi:hypothetical protein